MKLEVVPVFPVKPVVMDTLLQLFKMRSVLRCHYMNESAGYCVNYAWKYKPFEMDIVLAASLLG